MAARYYKVKKIIEIYLYIAKHECFIINKFSSLFFDNDDSVSIWSCRPVNDGVEHYI